MNKFKKIFKNKKMLKMLIGISSIALISSSAILLTSCSSNNDALTSDDLVSTGSGETYTVNNNNGLDFNLDIKKMFQESLKNRTSLEKLFKNKLGQQSLNIIEKIIELDGPSRYKYDLNEQKKKINSEYSEMVNNLKSSNPDDWQIILQKDTLDQNGGTEQTYKENKLYEWAITYLSSKIFEKSYLKISDGTNYYSKPTKEQILNASNGSSGLSFVFNANYSANEENENTFTNFYAAIQEYVFNLWMKIEQPFVVNMSLWKYSDPKNGIENFYNISSTSTDSGDSSSESTETYSLSTKEGESSEEGEEGSESTTKASYQFPYFQNGIYDGTNESLTTVDKFIEFVTNASNNYKIQNSSIGLIDIPQEYTEDSSTYILAKKSTIFNDLYPEFAAASMSLFNNDTSIPTKEVYYTKNQSNEFDTITSNFVSNSTINSQYETTVNSELVNAIIAENGNYKTYRNSNLYSIDAFKSSTASLNEFMFLRNSAGVHAIAIDGGQSFVSITDFSQKIEKMKMPILFRSMMSSSSYESSNNPVFNLDLNNELKTFFDSNINLIMFSLVNDALNNFNNPNTSDFTVVEAQKKYISNYILENNFDTISGENSVFKEWQEISFINNVIDNANTVQSKFIETKQTYNNNYGTNSPNNGLAARWIYSQDTSGVFEITKTYYNAFGNNISKETLQNKINNFNTTTIQSYVQNMESAGAFTKKIIKYSQQIWSTNNDVNIINYEYSKDSTNIQTFLINEVLKNESNSLADFDISNDGSNLITLKSSDNLSSLGSMLSDVQSNLIQEIALSKFYELDNSTKFDKYYELMNKNTINVDDINTYSKKLLLNDVQQNLSNEQTLLKSLYTSVLTLNYLLKDNGKNFISYVQTKINFGDDAYIVWTDTFNSKYDTLSTNSTLDVLNATGSRMIPNIDNSLNGMYFSENSNVLASSSSTNTSSASLYGVSSQHFKIKDNKFGYVGLQNESSNTLSSTTSEKLFNKDREAFGEGQIATGNEIYKGLLFKYGSKESLVNRINEMTNWSQIKNLIGDIQKKIPIFDMDKVENTSTIEDIKKVFLGDNLDGNSGIISQIPTYAFQRYEGTITVNPYYESVGTSTIKNATYVRQLNYEDLLYVNGNEGSGSITTMDQLKTNIGDTLFYDLLISAALDSNNQSIVINEIASNNKFTIYDVNVKNALGEKWVENWLLPSEK